MKIIKLPIMRIGDSVRVRSETEHPDIEEEDIGGWQGRIVKVSHYEPNCEQCDSKDECLLDKKESSDSLKIEFDSITLKKMSKAFIKKCMEYHEDFAMTWLSADEVVITTPRDTIDDTRAARLAICAEYGLISELDEDHDILFCMIQAGFIREGNKLSIKNIPSFIESLSANTRAGIRYFLDDYEWKKQKKQKEPDKPKPEATGGMKQRKNKRK